MGRQRNKKVSSEMAFTASSEISRISQRAETVLADCSRSTAGRLAHLARAESRIRRIVIATEKEAQKFEELKERVKDKQAYEKSAKSCKGLVHKGASERRARSQRKSSLNLKSERKESKLDQKVTIPRVKAKLTSVDNAISKTEKNNAKLQTKVKALNNRLQKNTVALQKGEEQSAQIAENVEKLNAKVGSKTVLAKHAKDRAKAVETGNQPAEQSALVALASLSPELGSDDWDEELSDRSDLTSLFQDIHDHIKNMSLEKESKNHYKQN